MERLEDFRVEFKRNRTGLQPKRRRRRCEHQANQTCEPLVLRYDNLMPSLLNRKVTDHCTRNSLGEQKKKKKQKFKCVLRDPEEQHEQKMQTYEYSIQKHPKQELEHETCYKNYKDTGVFVLR